MSASDDLDAGDFGSWVGQIEGALEGRNGADVPCGSCTACCTSSQFVHIAPDETDAQAHIPAALLFPAPGRPPGHVLMGYDERGHCPMLVDGACSIYEHRPRTCRTYDCRVFAATGLEPDSADKADIAERVHRWRFRFATDADRVRQAAMRAAATFVQQHAEALSAEPDSGPDSGPDAGAASHPHATPPSATQVAVLAVELHETFLDRDDHGAMRVVTPTVDEVRVEVRRRRRPR